jgi:hypothetical protein
VGFCGRGAEGWGGSRCSEEGTDVFRRGLRERMQEGGLGFCPPLPSSVLLRPSTLCSGLLSPYVAHCLPLSFFLCRCHSVLLCPRLCNPPLSCTLPSSVFSLSSPLPSSTLCPPLSSSALDGSATGANKWWSLSKWGRSGQTGEEGGWRGIREIGRMRKEDGIGESAAQD